MKKLISLIITVSMAASLFTVNADVLNDNSKIQQVPGNYLNYKATYDDISFSDITFNPAGSRYNTFSKCPGWFPCGKTHGVDDKNNPVMCPMDKTCKNKHSCPDYKSHIKYIEVSEITIDPQYYASEDCFKNIDGYSIGAVTKTTADKIVLTKNTEGYTLNAGNSFSAIVQNNPLIKDNTVPAICPYTSDNNKDYLAYQEKIQTKNKKTGSFHDENRNMVVPFDLIASGSPAKAKISVFYCNGVKEDVEDVQGVVGPIKGMLRVHFDDTPIIEEKMSQSTDFETHFGVQEDSAGDNFIVTMPSEPYVFTPYYKMNYYDSLDATEKEAYMLSNSQRTFIGTDAISIRMRSQTPEINGKTGDFSFSLSADKKYQYKNKATIELRALVHIQDPSRVEEKEVDGVVKKNNETIDSFVKAFDQISNLVASDTSVYTNLWSGNPKTSYLFTDYFEGKDFSKSNTKDGQEVDENMTRMVPTANVTKSNLKMTGYRLGGLSKSKITTSNGDIPVEKPFDNLYTLSSKVLLNSKQELDSLLTVGANEWYNEQYDGLVIVYLEQDIQIDISTNEPIVHSKITSYSNNRNAEARSIFHPLSEIRNSKSLLIKGVDTPDSDLKHAGFGIGTEIKLKGFKIKDQTVKDYVFYSHPLMFDIG